MTSAADLIHATVGKIKQYWVETIALKGGYFFEIDVFDRKGHEAVDLALANKFVATVVIK